MYSMFDCSLCLARPIGWKLVNYSGLTDLRGKYAVCETKFPVMFGGRSMTPAARVAAAIDILDLWIAGDPIEKLLTNWSRRSRFAGSKDRAALRDLVFAALRNRNSFAALGGALTGRGLMLGLLRARGDDPDQYFTGEGYGPSQLDANERAVPVSSEACDFPDWIVPDLKSALGDEFGAIERAMRQRAPLFLRVNSAKASVDKVITALATDGIDAQPHPLSPNAIEVTSNPRRFASSDVYHDGLAEIQDVASQAVADLVPAEGRLLDFCAGGGGKSLALAARGAKVTAHDISVARMKDIPERAERAGVKIAVCAPENLSAQKKFDVVFADAPCSGAGSWRRDPEGKWRLTQERLDELLRSQSEVLDASAKYVADGGVLAYATCSLLAQENQDQIASFLLRNTDWAVQSQKHFTPLQGGDGFYVAILARG